MFSLRKKIEAAVDRAELLAPMALEREEARRIKQEERVRGHDLWNNVHQSSDLLVKLANSTKVVEALKDLTYKAEEAKLITQLVDLDAINYGFFRQAYTASLDVSKLLDEYELSNLLRGPFDNEGACVKIEAGTMGFQSEIWVEKLLKMYTKWAEKQGFKGRIVEKCLLADGGIKSVEIEFEFKYAYGYLLGERGVHSMIGSFPETSSPHMVSLAAVDVIPLFLETSPDLLINDEDLEISSLSSRAKNNHIGSAVSIHHLPTGLRVKSSGERSCFANKMKAINRLKAKLLVIMRGLGLSDVKSVERNAIGGVWEEQARRYVFHPNKIVQDVKTGTQLNDLNFVLDGNFEHFIAASINCRQT
ncbi:peptide chain release factor PrfB3, chloroplastic isoform X2 [Impatiens glandulifera]|nr:peptide chain release factor PrfB3, chloroplastic isoform X2 [Impatiens glandulifera]